MSEKKTIVNISQNLNDRRIQWHMAVMPAMKLEFMQYSQILEYIPEYLLRNCSEITCDKDAV